MEKNTKTNGVTKKQVEDNKAFLMSNLTYESTLADFNKLPNDKAFIFRGKLFNGGQAVKVVYDGNMAKDDKSCTGAVDGVGFRLADNVKKYVYKEFSIVEIKQGTKSIMYAFKDNKLVFANISKHYLLHELALKYGITFNKANSALAVLAGRKDGVSKANKEIVEIAVDTNY